MTYALNPYTGCQHACVYCYSVFMKRFTGHKEEWGTFVDAKINAPEVLTKELKRAKPGEVLLSSVTDPYQPLERRYRLTRACLEVLSHHPGFKVGVLTKSALVLEDLDLLQGLSQVEVGFTITGMSEEVQRIFEPYASPYKARLEALGRLVQAGIDCWVFFGPVLPFVTDGEDMEALFRELAQVGVKRVLVDSLNLSGAMWSRVARTIALHYAHLLEEYRLLRRDRHPYSVALGERARTLAAEYHLECETCF